MLVLLDTTVAAGVVSYLNPNGNSNPSDKSENWKNCVRKLVEGVSGASIAIPTPVFYELASKDKKIYEALENIKNQRTPSNLFRYCNHSITSQVLSAASKLRMLSGIGGSQMIDSILAAYCLVFGHLIITPNQKDFPQRFFDVKAMCLAPMPTNKSERTVLFLLEPKLAEWAQA